MSVTIQLRRDTAANWTSANPVLNQGEPGYETDTGKLKYGDGATAWTSLAYFAGGSAVSTVFGRTGTVTAQSGDYTVSEVTGAAPLASPALTGSPTAPTQTTGDGSTKIATDAFVAAAVAAEASRAEAAEALRAPLASPALTGVPTAPTATALTDGTQLATTAYADSAVAVEVARAMAAEALKAGLLTPTAVQTANYTASPGDYAMLDTSSGALAGNLLPQAPADKTVVGWKIVNSATSVNSATITCQGSDVINKAGGGTALTLTLLDQGVALQYKAAYAVWYIVGDDVPLSQLDLRYPGWINVRGAAYGAAGNGTTDDTAAVNAALAAALPGQVVYAPTTGEPYVISGPLVVPAGVTLLGDCGGFGIPIGNYGLGGLPVGGTIFKPSSSFTAGPAVISLTSGDAQSGGQRLYGFSVDASNMTTSTVIHGIQGTNATAGVKIRDVLVYGGGGSGALKGNGLDVRPGVNASPDFWDVSHSKFSGCHGAGVNANGLADSWFSFVESTGNYGSNWTITNGNNSRYFGCKAEGSGIGQGWYLTSGTGFTGQIEFVGCTSSQNYLDGWYLTGAGAGVWTFNGIRSTADASSSGDAFTITGGFAGVAELTGVTLMPANVYPAYGLKISSAGSACKILIANSVLWGVTGGVSNDGSATGQPLYGGSVILGSGALATPAFTVAPLSLAQGGTGVSAASDAALLAALGAMATPSGTPFAGATSVSTGSSGATKWGPGNGVTIMVPAPAGATATDTPNVTAAITSLATALASGPAVLQFQDGTYQIDSNEAIIQDLANFAVLGTGATVIAQAPNRTAVPNNVAGDLFFIADCADFRVEGITFDGMRDTVAPLAPLTATASSGQNQVTVASGAGASYTVGQRLSVNGGIGSTDAAKDDTGPGHGLTISAITAGGGTGGGDLITFSSNLANSYTQISPTLLSDAFGPYACAGAYVTPYQTGTATVAGRTLANEDQQVGLHILSSQRFTVDRVTARNTWQSPIRLGTGYETSTLTDGCQQGVITACSTYHGYDQGISVWLSKQMTVSNCLANATGWAGICLTQSDYSTVTGNIIISPVYQALADNNGGCGVVTEGGLRNTFHGNVIISPYADGIRVTNSPLQLPTPANCPTISSYLPGGTAAGTSVTLSSTTYLTAGWSYSIVDGSRTEAVTVVTASGGAVTFAENTKFSHAAGTYIVSRVGQENVISGNVVHAPALLSGIQISASVRSVVKNNTVSNWALTAGGTGNPSGVSCQPVNSNSWASHSFPSGVYVAGNGSTIEGNTFSGGAGSAINCDSSDGLNIRGNTCYGLFGSYNMVSLTGLVNGEFTGNTMTGSETSSGLYVNTGGLSGTVPARFTIAKNLIANCDGSGMRLSSGHGLVVEGNIVTSCAGPGGIDLHGVQYCTIANNQCVSNYGPGIYLEDNAASYNLYNIITGNVCFDDGTGANVATGATWTQPYGIRETGNSNSNLITGNTAYGNATGQIVTTGAATAAYANMISGVLTGAFPAALIPQLADYAPAGLTGATAASRYAGATASGAPTSGTFAAGDYVVDQTGAFWVCTTAGTVGGACVFTAVSGSGGALTNPMTALGDSIYGGASGTATRLAGNTSAVRGFLTSAGTGSAAQAPAWTALQVDDLPYQPWVPSDNGLLVANFPLTSGAGTAQPTAGTLYLHKVLIRQAITWTNVWFVVVTGGSGTSNGSYVGLYNSAGALLSGSADIGTSLTSGGAKEIPLTTPQALSAATFVWVALLVSLPTTQPTILKSGTYSLALNLGLTAATAAIATNGTGLTALPSSITPSANSGLTSDNNVYLFGGS